MTPLGPEQFAAFYRAANGYPPFPWQARLVKEIHAHGGRWPAVLDLPTSAGKTSALDAAVFLLALEVVEGKDGKPWPKPVEKRAAAVRTFFVVDRRIVVDEAGEKAKKLAKLLNAADGKPHMADRLQALVRKQRDIKPDKPDPLTPSAIEMLRTVAERLEAFGGDKALHVSVLRGGMYRDGSWAESPTQPTVCLSTVDQVGSRLLFRGYGVGPAQRAVHAGLVGNDALILVDEAHLSRPFLETLKAVEFYRSRHWAEKDHHVETPFQVVVMSATAGESAAAIGPMAAEEVQRPPQLGLSAEDRADPTLAARLGASKVARLEEVKGGSDDEDANRRAFAEALAGFARELATPTEAKPKKGQPAPDAPPPAAVIGVVVNRVDTARRVHHLLAADPDVHAILLTGRIRPYDRDRLLDRWFRYMEAKADRPPAPDGKKLFVVATQTIECGANLSLDALVTEAAPLDALRQRFGRLDRLGKRTLSAAVIVARLDLLKKDDPVYSDRVKATWTWLGDKASGPKKLRRIDFGIDMFDTLLPADPKDRRDLLASLCAPAACAPVLMPAHVDDLAQTNPAPVPDPSPELFLHGPASGPADVSVVWRADLSADQLKRAAKGGDAEEEVIDTVALVPPVSMEALPVPIWAVRKWLAQDAPGDVTDLEGEAEPPADGRRRTPPKGRPFLRWRGPDADDGSEVDTKPRPEDTIVVPSEYGGCDGFGWNPGDPAPVRDIADDCSWRAKRKPVLRVRRDPPVHAVALTAWGVPPDADGRSAADVLASAVTPDEDTGEVAARAIRNVLKSWPELPDWLDKALKDRKGKAGRELPYPDGSGRVLVLPVQKPDPEEPERNDPAADGDGPSDGEAGNFLGRSERPADERDKRVWLEQHCRDVRDRIAGYADKLGLERFREVLSRAGLLHDAGKADPRFQAWLYGGEAVFAQHGGKLIAKSDGDGRNAARMNALRKQARWPKHARHEALSVLLVRDNPDALKELPDPDLLVHLIGTHHGRGRPLWPVTLDDGLPDGADPAEVEKVPVGCVLEKYTLSRPGVFRPEAVLTPLHAGWADQFWKMVGRYGAWGLAYLEALVVLADHRQSKAEEEANRE